MWPSGDCLDRSFTVGVTVLARLHNSVLRLTATSLIHWLIPCGCHPLSLLLCLLDTPPLLSFLSRACLHPSNDFILNKHHVRGFDVTFDQTCNQCFEIAPVRPKKGANLLMHHLIVLLGFLFIP